MKFTTTTVAGSGRGKSLGFPTINMLVPEMLPMQMEQGVYAAHAVVNGEKYDGALYYGPAVTFGEHDPMLEIYLFDTIALYVGADADIEIEIVKFIRPVMEFDVRELLVRQMENDVIAIRKIVQREE